MEFDQKALLDALNGHLKNVKGWINDLEKNVKKGSSFRLTWMSSNSKNQQHSALPTMGSSYKQSERQMQNEQHDASPCIENIRTQIKNLEKEIDKVMKSLPGTRKEQSTKENQKSTTAVQVYDRDGYLADDFMTAANTWTGDQFKMMKVEAVSDIDKDKPLLLLCQADSRLKSDADYASEFITNLKDYQMAAFVIIHMKEEFALPDISSQLVLCGDERYKNIRFADAAITKSQKYYKCKMNSDAARTLFDVLPKTGSANYPLPSTPADLEDYRAAFLVIHMKEAFALSDISSKSVLCEDGRYQNLHFIDAAFTKKQKFYESKMNSDAATQLIDFLKSIGPTSAKNPNYMQTLYDSFFENFPNHW